jgi:tRNA-modifying protein YgfZ
MDEMSTEAPPPAAPPPAVPPQGATPQDSRPQDAPPQSGRLPHLGLLRFTGPDSLSFLQGQVSNDTRRLAENRSLLAAYSSPQGRVLALMHLLPHSTGIVGILPRELVLPTLEGLRRFVLRAKVKIEDAAEFLCVAGEHGAHRLQSAGFMETAGSAENTRYTEMDGIGVAAVNRDPGRYWVIGAAGKLAEHGLGGDQSRVEGIEHDWRLADIRAGLPQIYLPTREAFVAQMLNLDLLDGISFSKGCYTGQEIIARTQHLGRIKRRLSRLQLPPGDWRIGQPLRLKDGRAGRLVEVVRSGGHFEALAVLNVEVNSTAADGESADDTPIAAVGLPLPYEL